MNIKLKSMFKYIADIKIKDSDKINKSKKGRIKIMFFFFNNFVFQYIYNDTMR